MSGDREVRDERVDETAHGSPGPSLGRRSRSRSGHAARPAVSTGSFEGVRPPVAMRSPTSFLSAVRPSTVGDELAAIHDADPVRHLEDLVELGRDEEDGGPGVALLDDPAVDELDAPDVEAARRLVEDEQAKVAIELAGHDDLLLVAA